MIRPLERWFLPTATFESNFRVARNIFICGRI